VAYHPFILGGGGIYLPVASLESDPKTETILKWGYRLLYLEISLFLLTSMFYWEYPFTLPFAGAILAFFYVAQIWKHAKFDDDKKTRESSMTVE
jgi:hypothetical protein